MRDSLPKIDTSEMFPPFFASTLFSLLLPGGPGGRNIKREAKDKKYGFGGKKREKGQSDPRSLNDLSAYNPKQGGSGRSRSVSFFL